MMIIYVFYNCHCRSRNDNYSTWMLVNIIIIIITSIIIKKLFYYNYW